ncbi:DUF1428 domain-containing protein [Gallaecimonas xiamenensis]|uniref:RNA signal recognition particle 4.5S RNA n=1 Tax=Gallaecimonas xiamenensis 3-C-1 TaxID=745411 RepID=K2JML3_9GAMM|nr:DUF1428 domain-containing protein [Gallaecimonas xiamenensis]EKE71694.1 hypothetical protein B3C1_12184 [Gallaecimonas xiamenensis 3-C-1]
MAYVDGFVVPVPKGKLDQYLALARQAGAVWMEHGALSYVEAVEEDVKDGELTSFPQAIKRQEGELVIFAWITFASRQARDSINAKVMADPRLAQMMDPSAPPFDGKRMFWGGFEVAVQLGQ